jgi:hypothetical protein
MTGDGIEEMHLSLESRQKIDAASELTPGLGEMPPQRLPTNAKDPLASRTSSRAAPLLEPL